MTTNLDWRVNTPQLIVEMVECNPSGGALIIPASILRNLLAEVAGRAIELDDPALNILMLRLALYEVPPMQITEHIKEQEKRR